MGIKNLSLWTVISAAPKSSGFRWWTQVGDDAGLTAAVPEREGSLLSSHLSWMDAEERDRQGQEAEPFRKPRGQTGIGRLF